MNSNVKPIGASPRRRKLALLVAAAGLALAAGPVSAAYNWGTVAIGAGGFVAGIEASPAQNGLIYARTDVGGAYRFNSVTDSWVPITDMFPLSQGNYLGIESIAPDPSNANIVYAAGGMYESSGNGVILKSTDQGATWSVNSIGVQMGGNDMGRGIGERLAVDPNQPSILYFGSRNGGLMKSSDAGVTWAKVASFPTNGGSFNIGWAVPSGLGIVIIDGQGGTAGTASSTIFVAAADTQANSNLYRSNNGGATWSLVAGGPSGMMAHHAGLGSDGNLWLAYSNDMGPWNYSGATLAGQVWKYNVATGVWTNVTPNHDWGGMAGGLSVDAQNPLHVAVSTLDWYAPDRILATSDGGSTWAVIGQPPVSYWATGVSTYNNNGVLYWYPGGATTIGTGPTNWVEALAIDPFNSAHAFHGCGAGIWESTNIQSGGAQGSGVVWNFNDAGLEETVPQFMMPSIGTGSAFLGVVGDLGGMRNSSLTAYSSTGEYANPICNNNNGIDFAESNPNFVVRVGNSGTSASDVSYSNDNGQTWTPCTAALPGYGGPNQMGSVAVGADGKTIIASPYIGKGSPAWSTNNGASWTTCTGLPSGAQVAADRVTPTLFYGTSAGTLYVSTNSGQSFSSAGTFTYNGAPRPVFGQSGEVWVADNNGGPLWRFTGLGTANTKVQVSSVSAVWGVGFGKAASGYTHPAVYIIGTVGGQYGYYRCDDGVGTAWTRINDNQHQYGWLQGCYIGGDENVYGRCYLTSAGRGYIYGDLVAGTPTPNVTPSRTTTPTLTSTATATRTVTLAASPTPSASPTGTATPTATRTVTVAASPSPSPSPSASASASASASPTCSVTPTATPTPSAAISPSVSPSASITASLTPSPMASPTLTATGSATPTPLAATPSPTGTRTLSPAGSPTASATLTPSALPTLSLTPTPSSSASGTAAATVSASPSPSGTAALTPTDSPTGASTSTQTPALTVTPSASATALTSPSSTMTPPATPSATASVGASATPTPAATLTVSPGPSSTATGSSTATASPTATASLTATASPTATASSTATASPTASVSPTAASSLTPTASPSVEEGNGPLVISSGYGVPDPDPLALSVQLTGPADRLDVAVYTAAEVLALDLRSAGLEAGWNSVALPSAFGGLPNGVYYIRLVAYRGRQASVARLIKVMVLH